MDTFMLSHYSDDTVAAVGVVNQLLSLVFLVFGVSTVGTSVLCSQYLGASQQANVRQVIGVSLFFNTLIGVTTSAFLYFRAEALLKIMDLAPELIDEGLAYMQIVGGFAFLASYCANQYVRRIAKSRQSVLSHAGDLVDERVEHHWKLCLDFR